MRRSHLPGAVLSAILLATASMFPSCGSEVLPVGPCVPNTVHIDPAKVDPPPAGPVVLGRGEPATFDVQGAVPHITCTSSFHYLRYAWYPDYDDNAGLPLPLHEACSSASICQVDPCKAFPGASDDHRMLLVVSRQALPETAKSPTDFPEGAPIDTIEWNIKLHGNCP